MSVFITFHASAFSFAIFSERFFFEVMEEADNNNLKDGVGLSSENEGTTSECKSCPSELTPDSTFVQKEVLNEKEDVGSCGKPEFWVQLQNLPHSMRHRNIKPFLTR